MNVFRFMWPRLGLLLGLFAFTARAEAADFRLGVTVAPNPVALGNALVYTIQLTNISGLTLTEVQLTNTFSATATAYLNSSSNTLSGTITNYASAIVFRFPTLPADIVGTATLVVAPEAAGPFTNFLSIIALGLAGHTNVATNVVAQVNHPDGDLAVGLTNAPVIAMTNDLTVIGLFATNLGPSTVSGITVSNALSASFSLVSVSTTNYSYGGSNLIWNVGTLASGSSTQLLVTVRPVDGGVFNLAATIAGNVNDTNAANNAVGTNVVNVATPLPSDLEFIVVSQRISRQTGLLEMSGVLTNKAATNVPAARMTVSGLTGYNWLYSAAGTNSGIPYVSYNNPITNRSAVNLTLEFYAVPRGPLSNLQFSAFAVDLPSAVVPTNAAVPATGAMTSWGFLVEFPTTIGRTYTILYSDDAAFSNPRIAQPSIRATANRLQWIDTGPPKTISIPPPPGGRFYRVLESP